MGYGIYCDWLKEWENVDKWENNSYRVLCNALKDKKGKDFKAIAKELEILEDDGTLPEYWEETISENTNPIYNFIYPLNITPKDEDILKVSLKTNCCVLLNTDTNEYFLSLTGCGMDLSQDIALSYLWLEKWIPFELMRNVCTQKALSISKEEFKELKKAILEQAESYKGLMDRVINDWK